MIVKTGANYQAEGGYIEASKEGNIITVGDGETSAKIMGSAPYGGFINLHIVNQSDREVRFTQLTSAPNVGEYLGEPGTNIVGGSEGTITVPSYIGIKQRVTYTGLRTTTWKSSVDPAKIVVEVTADGYLTFMVKEQATDGMTVDLYLEG